MKKELKIISQSGFTLVELLSSIIVLVAIGVIVVGIITSSLRGTNKTNSVENIRQNGNYAISQMSKNIQFSQVFNGFSNNGTDYVTGCVNFPVSPTPFSSDSAYSYLQITQSTGNTIEYFCQGGNFTANGESLVNEASVAVSNCTITCTQEKLTDSPIIGISFDLLPARTSNLPEDVVSPIKFETSVTLKNYKK
jgi:type II secretory pathway pseudopilin PulG